MPHSLPMLTVASPPQPEPSSSSTWSGWGPSYYQPPSQSSTSSSTGGGCRPHTSHTSQWPNSSSTPITTLVTTRPVTITTFTTEPWSTVMGDATSSSSTDTGLPYYPMPTWTRCPYAEDVFNCGGGNDDEPVALAVEMRTEDQPDEDDSSVTGETTPGSSGDLFAAARGKSDAVLGSIWLVLGVMAFMV